MTARSARILAAAAGLTAAVSAGLAAALINAAIVRKPPVSDETADDSDLVAATYAEFAYHLRARHLPARLILPLASQMCRMLAGYRITQASPLGAIADIAVPVLLIHGGADTYNPTAMAHELHAAQPHADLWIVPGADHVMSYFTDPRAYRKRVEQFLRRLPLRGGKSLLCL